MVSLRNGLGNLLFAPRIGTGQLCRPYSMGSHQLCPHQHDVHCRFWISNEHMPIANSYCIPVLCLRWQCWLSPYWPLCLHFRSNYLGRHAKIHHSLGRRTLCHWQSTLHWQKLLVLYWFPLEKQQMALLLQEQSSWWYLCQRCRWNNQDSSWLEPHKANETLCIFIAMDDNQKAQVSNLHEKAELFVEQVRTGFITHNEELHSLHSTIMKTLKYPMEAISLTKDQWNYIMMPILKSVLPQSSIIHNFPRDILYAPTSLFGMGLMHPYYKQHLKQLSLVLKELQKQDITAEWLTSTLEQLQLESGLPCTDNDWQLPCPSSNLTKHWLHHLLSFCDSHKISIHDTCPQLSKFMSQDNYLMQEFIKASFDHSSLCALNECRMYLRVITLSDIYQ